jgi:hypothetical protein
MAAAGWYRDPTREGRLRYWDGSAWTEHVSAGGGMAVEPITGIPPAPPAGHPVGTVAGHEQAGSAEEPAAAQRAAPGAGQVAADPLAESRDAPPGAAGAPYPPTPIARIGFVIAAVGGVLAAASAGSTAVDQGFVTISVAGGSWIGVVAAILCLGAAAAPWPWARVAGVTASGAFALLVAFALIGFRTSDELLPGVDVSLGPAGWLMLAGSLLLFAGTAVALARFRVPAAGPDPSRAPSGGKAVVSMILGIVGVLIPVAAAPAVGVGLFALDDVTAAGGTLSGRGFARAGIVLGAVSLLAWGVGLTLAMLLAQP